MDNITITISDYLTRSLAMEIAAAQWRCEDWANRVSDFIYNYKTKSDCFNIIARADGKVIGRLQCLKSTNAPHLWQYCDFFVKPEFRRRHIGETMFQMAQEVLQDRRCRTLRCYVEPNNIPSMSFQRKHGFLEKAFQTFDDLINDGDLMFEKELQNFEAVPADISDAYYICEAYEKSLAELHGKRMNEHEYKMFFDEVKEMLAYDDPDEKNFLIYFGAVPCGWLKVNGLCSNDISWVSMLAVEPRFRRRGVGRFAVNYAVKFISGFGKKKVGIHTTEDNISAIALYKSCGFSVCKNYSSISEDGIEREYLTFEKNI